MDSPRKYKMHVVQQQLAAGTHQVSSQEAYAVTFETDAHSIALGATINGIRPFVGTTEFRCPTIDGIIDQQFTVIIPQGKAYMIVSFQHIHYV